MSEKMIFCLGDGKYESKGNGYQKHLQIFNKDVTEDVYNSIVELLKDKKFQLPITKWIELKDIESPTETQKQLGGYLKTISYKDAWAELWAGLSLEDKKFFTTLPNYDVEIFEKITGIKPDFNSLSGKKIEVKIDGVAYTATLD